MMPSPGAGLAPPHAYFDRRDGGRVLAQYLTPFANRHDVVVLGLPRGGVPVADEVAKALAAPLDVLVVRKLGVPGQVELAMGAIASGGVRVLDEDVIRSLRVPSSTVGAVTGAEQVELERRERLFRADRRVVPIEGCTVVLVDDGLATGSTMRAAILAVRERRVAEVIVAAPVGARESCSRLRLNADAVVCPMQPEEFVAVGLWYRSFEPTSDDEVRRILAGTT
jgi:putative phosphoribosyl transferase